MNDSSTDRLPKSRLIPTKPVSETDQLLLEGFTKEIINQPQRMDDLAKLIITLELAIPGAYTTVIKLINTDINKVMLFISFGLWFISLILTLLSLLPRKWAIDSNTLRTKHPVKKGQLLSIEDFFSKSTNYKRWLLTTACLVFFCGVFVASLSII